MELYTRTIMSSRTVHPGNPVQLLVCSSHSLLDLKSLTLPMHHLEPKANAHADFWAPPSVKLPLLCYLVWQTPATLQPCTLISASSAQQVYFSFLGLHHLALWFESTPWAESRSKDKAKFLCVPLSHGSQFFTAFFPCLKRVALYILSSFVVLYSGKISSISIISLWPKAEII